MNWKEFYKVNIFKVSAKGESLLYHTSISTPEDIPVHELFMPKFGKLELSHNEKRKLCINTRKILHCRHLLETKYLRDWAREFVQKIEAQKEDEIELKTSGAGIYLILAAIELYPHISKKIICYTTEIPFKVSNKKLGPTQNWQLVYGPETTSFLSDFPSLWRSSPYLSLFVATELKKAA
jgi:hypothetical protein